MSSLALTMITGLQLDAAHEPQNALPGLPGIFGTDILSGQGPPSIGKGGNSVYQQARPPGLHSNSALHREQCVFIAEHPGDNPHDRKACQASPIERQRTPGAARSSR
jgi:hypothetical protein